MNGTEKAEIDEAYGRLEALLKKHLPAKRRGSLHCEVHLKLTESRLFFAATWDEPEDKHLTEDRDA